LSAALRKIYSQDIRFHEVLDTERVASNEKKDRVVVRNGSQVPLSLRRSMSQSCDPHRASIWIELGNFEETVGRVELPGLPQSGRSKSLLFSYRVTTKIAVDTVGSHRYPIDWNIDRRSQLQATSSSSKTRSLGWVIVRVALNDGVKIVTIESPLMLKSDVENDLLCEVRDHGGLSLLWRCLLRKSEDHGSAAYYPVPPDIVPSLHHTSNFFGIAALPKNVAFEHETDVPQINVHSLTRISPPAPYSSSSIGKGLIDESQVCVQILDPHFGKSSLTLTELGVLHVDVCSLRIGSFTFDHHVRDSQNKENFVIPEQRLIVFRSCIAIRNYLAFPIQIQVKASDGTKLSTNDGNRIEADDSDDWTNLGVLDCSLDRLWSEAKPFAAFDMRIRMVGNDVGNSYQFPHWSLPVTISTANLGEDDLQHRPLHLKLHDSSGVPLFLCVVVNSDDSYQDQASSMECVKNISPKLSIALRVFNIYAPFWIVNSTGLDLQFKSRDYIAGQFDVGFLADKSNGERDSGLQDTLGLGELLDDTNLSYLRSHDSFEVLMLGNEASSTLQIRRRSSRLLISDGRVSSWSDPVVISDDARPYQDFIVHPPPNHSKLTRNQTSDTNGCVPFLLRCRILKAPVPFGGKYGTKLVHIVCRYVVVNELGSEIEILSGDAQCTHLSIAADSYPHSFHFDDSLPIRVRPKEFGWLWSGKFNLRNLRREITFSVKHSIKKRIILVTVECHSKHPAGTCIVVFRKQRQAPYRIENHSMFPIKFDQVQKFTESLFSRHVDSNATHNIILPFHNAEFAWNEPEYGRRLIRLELAEFGDLLHNLSRCPLGTFSIDSIVPGSEIDLPHPNLMGKVMADGPCRVLRISQSSESESTQISESLRFPSLESSFVALTATISARFVHGFGVSIVDWQPQELIYIRFRDIQCEVNAHREKETLKISVESVVVDNQLWVTSYPVLLRVGTASKKRKNSRQSAVSLYVNRVHTKQSIAGNFTQIENCTLSSLPIIVCIDGNLAAFALQMVRRAKQIVSKNSPDILTMNQLLRKALHIVSKNDNDDTELHQTGALAKVIRTQNWYHAVDCGMATTAIASKLKFWYRPPDLVAASKRAYASINSAIFGFSSTQRHKIYIERLRISTTAAEISWSGVLPVASSMPRLLRPTLTFEGLPLMLRAYSSSHVFGSLEEHLWSIKSHYLSIWRFVDLLVGVTMNPSFLVRACMFTSRESFSLFLSSIANGLCSAEKYWKALVPKSWDEDSLSRLNLSWGRSMIKWSLLGTSSVLSGLSKLSASTAMLLQYDASRHRASGGLVRGRNPRLFAHVDGNNLLVQYVEGENAGKAILSRVGSGELLGEGYIYHVEGVHLPKNVTKGESGMDPAPFILMLTFDRMLLLHGKLDNEFCNVVWESTYVDVVFVEYCPEQRHDDCACILIWYLNDRTMAGSSEERFAKSITNDAGGLDTLQCKQMFVPTVFMNTLRSRLRSVAPAE
jgi:SHR-binding domain of vacuolar-sorting associated protein 13